MTSQDAASGSPADRPNSTHGSVRERLRRKPSPPVPWRVEGTPGQTPPGRRPNWSRLWWLLLALLVVNWIVASLMLGPAPRTKVSYTFFTTQVDCGQRQGDHLDRGHDRGRVQAAGGLPAGYEGRQAGRPVHHAAAVVRQRQPVQAAGRTGVPVNANPPDQPAPLWRQVLVGFGPTLLFIGLLVWFLRRSAAGGGLAGLGGFGRSRAEAVRARVGTPDHVRRRGGHRRGQERGHGDRGLPAQSRAVPPAGCADSPGVLLSGPPGTGKTLLARAVAGEAKVPFFSISAAEFIEMIVGVGASRVRDLFEQAKKVAPSIIFIDELDAIGRARGGAQSIGGHDEREQTLNQILTEMDGFTGNEGVVVLAATNRPEVLDPALLRPGRFDRRVTVSPPDLAGRRQILDVHTRGVPLADDVDLDDVAASTPGMVGADLKNLVNEAALLAARRGHDKVTAADFSDALEKVVLGTVRGIMLSPEEKERTAFHESGHALLGMLTPGADPVRKVSIIPRGQALGVTFQSPQTDRYGYSANTFGAASSARSAGGRRRRLSSAM